MGNVCMDSMDTYSELFSDRLQQQESRELLSGKTFPRRSSALSSGPGVLSPAGVDWGLRTFAQRPRSWGGRSEMCSTKKKNVNFLLSKQNIHSNIHIKGALKLLNK